MIFESHVINHTFSLCTCEPFLFFSFLSFYFKNKGSRNKEKKWVWVLGEIRKINKINIKKKKRKRERGMRMGFWTIISPYSLFPLFEVN